MNKKLAATESGLTNYYKMTDGSNAILTDNKGSSAGAISGATRTQPDAFPVDVFASGTYASGYKNVKATFDAINARTHMCIITITVSAKTTEKESLI
jgi:hypothetical protein